MAQARSTKLTHARTTCRLSPSCRCGRWNLRRSAPRKQQLPLKSRSAPHSNQVSPDQARNRQLRLSRAPTGGTSAESSCSRQIFTTRETTEAKRPSPICFCWPPSDMIGCFARQRAARFRRQGKYPTVGRGRTNHRRGIPSVAATLSSCFSTPIRIFRRGRVRVRALVL